MGRKRPSYQLQVFCVCSFNRELEYRVSSPPLLTVKPSGGKERELRVRNERVATMVKMLPEARTLLGWL